MKFSLQSLSKFFLIFLLFNSFSSLSAESDKKVTNISEVWGQIVQVDPKQLVHGYQYFVYYVQDNKEYAYPIEVKDKQQEQNLKKYKNKLAKISGSIHSFKLEGEAETTTIMYFRPTTISPLQLSDLAVINHILPSTERAAESAPLPRYRRQPEGGIRIPDAQANAIIFAAGAVLMGSIIKDYVGKNK